MIFFSNCFLCKTYAKIRISKFVVTNGNGRVEFAGKTIVTIARALPASIQWKHNSWMRTIKYRVGYN